MTNNISRRELLGAGAASLVSLNLAARSMSAKAKVERPENDLEEEILIPEGDFLTGTSEQQVRRMAETYGYHRSWYIGEVPQRKLFLPSFKIDKYPVTNKQYAHFCKSRDYPPPKLWKDKKIPEILPDHPVSGVSWRDAMEYTRWIGKHLPTEAQWEKAARGTDGRIFPWGNDFNPNACVWNRSHLNDKSTDSVRAHPEGASPYGVMDMCGNVSQWCQDGPSDSEGGSWINNVCYIKGGSWINNEPFFLRAACRSMSGYKENACSFYGLRCVREVK